MLTLRPWMPRTIEALPVDQAVGLRALLERRAARSEATSSAVSRCRTLAVTSGKGGVGKSVIAVNFSIALALLGQRVCLIDANVGLGNVELLCGLNGYWNLAHFLSGARTLEELVLPGPGGLDVLPGGSALAEITQCPTQVQASLWRELSRWEANYDWLVVDTGSGAHRLARQWSRAADQVLIVTTPEATAIAEAYATIKGLHRHAGPELNVLVNQATGDEAERILERLQATARSFLLARLGLGTHCPVDPAIPRSVRRREPCVLSEEESPASRALRQLAARWVGQPWPPRDEMTGLVRLSTILKEDPGVA
jgi:flagellar biosynthesis protein FlhG